MVERAIFKEDMIVFFDIDRTLMNFEAAEDLGIMAVFEKYKSEIRMESSEFKSEWKKWAQVFFDMYSSGKLTFDEQRKARVSKLFELNGFPLKDETELENRFNLYWSVYEKEYGLFPDALPALKKISFLKIPMGIISNGDSKNQRGKLIRAGVLDFFSPIVISSEIGFSKPDEKIFLKAMELAGSLPKDTWYIGDSIIHDIEPARKLKINTLYLNRKRKAELKIEEENPFYAEVNGFLEVIEIIEKFA